MLHAQTDMRMTRRRRGTVIGKKGLYFAFGLGLLLIVFSWRLSSGLYHFHDDGSNHACSSLSLHLKEFQTMDKQPGAPSYPIKRIDFLNMTQVSNLDAYSASWLQPLDQFLTMKLENMKFLEDASFFAFERTKRKRLLRMTPDWLDFSVEHLSKWWKMLEIFQHATVYQSLMQKYQAYLSKAPHYPINTSFHQTLAVIPFIQVQADTAHNSQKAYYLTKYTLAVTIESLRRAGFGRIVVAGLHPESEEALCQDTFRHWKAIVEQRPVPPTEWVATVGDTQVTYVHAPPQQAATQLYFKFHIPRATLWGLRAAFRLSQKNPSRLSQNETQFIQQWLGDIHNASHWKYIYYTEADSVLQTRPRTLPLLKQQFNEETTILVPHRFQPIPHASDLMHGQPLPSNKDHLYLPNQPGSPFGHVLELDAFHPHHDGCCDEFQGPNFKPGNMEKVCDNHWFMCHFNPSIPKVNRTHTHLQHYALIRLTQGIGVVSLASLNSGRRCVPTKHAVCKPPYVAPHGAISMPYP